MKTESRDSTIIVKNPDGSKRAAVLIGDDPYAEEIVDILDSEVDMKVEDDESASRALYHYRRIKEELARVQKIAKARKADIDQWLVIRTLGLEKTLKYFSHPLRSFMDVRHSADKKIKSIKFPEGKISLRARQDELVLEDGYNPADHVEIMSDEVPSGNFVRAYVPDNDFIEPTGWRLSDRMIRAHIKETGEIPSPVVEMKKQDPTFSIKLSEEGS